MRAIRAPGRRHLNLLLARYRRMLAWGLVLSTVQAFLLLPVALIVRRIFDELVPHHDVAAIIWSGAAIMALYLASAAVGLWSGHAILKVTKAAVADLRYRTLERVVSFPKAYIDHTRLGELHSLIVWDSERVDLMSYALIGLLSSIPISIGLSCVLLVLNPVLFLVLMCVVPVLISVSRLLGRRVRMRTKVWQTALQRFSSETQLALRMITLMKVHSAESVELANRKRQLAQLAEAGRQRTWLQMAYVLVSGAVAASAGVVVLIVGGVAVAGRTMTLGELLSFYAVLALLLRQVNMIVSNAPQVIAGDEALLRLEELLETHEPEPYSGERVLVLRGAIALENVNFGYGDEQLLKQVTLRVQPGERVALVGPNGAGKSTVLSLVLGLYRPRSGRLIADDVPYAEVDMRSLRRQIGVVLQDPVIFPGSIRENIAYGSPDATDEEVRRAAELATVDFIDSLPAGLDTDVGDEGDLLSGGQRQRIAVARVLLGNPALLILDEPTTHLDDSSIVRLMASLRALPGEPGMLLITHDPEVACQADIVYELRDGRIVAVEDPSTLAARHRVGQAASV